MLNRFYCDIGPSVASNMALHLSSMVPYWIHMELQQFPLILLYSRRETIVEDPQRARGCG